LRCRCGSALVFGIADGAGVVYDTVTLTGKGTEPVHLRLLRELSPT